MSKMPQQHPGDSEQSVSTPLILLNAVKKKLGIQEFECDLAASHDNAVCSNYYTEEDNSLIQPWNLGDGWNWCNPPYSFIYPWVQKAWKETSTEWVKTAMLLPAGVGSDWWAEHVDGKAHVLLMHGRVTFVGHNHPYPKDTVVLLYSRACIGGYEVWDWRKE